MQTQKQDGEKVDCEIEIKKLTIKKGTGYICHYTFVSDYDAQSQHKKEMPLF